MPDQLTCVQTLRHRGGIDEVAAADLARYVRIDRLQLHAPLHAGPRLCAELRYYILFIPILQRTDGLPAVDFSISHSRAENAQNGGCARFRLVGMLAHACTGTRHCGQRILVAICFLVVI